MRSARFTFYILALLTLSIVDTTAQTGTNRRSSSQAMFDSTSPSPAKMGSTYVPLDSWVYGAIERLAALGYVQTGFLGQRPWTRMECARLVAEAQERAAEESDSEASSLYRSLSGEFALELRREDGLSNVGFQVE